MSLSAYIQVKHFAKRTVTMTAMSSKTRKVDKVTANIRSQSFGPVLYVFAGCVTTGTSDWAAVGSSAIFVPLRGCCRILTPFSNQASDFVEAIVDNQGYCVRTCNIVAASFGLMNDFQSGLAASSGPTAGGQTWSTSQSAAPGDISAPNQVRDPQSMREKSAGRGSLCMDRILLRPRRPMIYDRDGAAGQDIAASDEELLFSG